MQDKKCSVDDADISTESISKDDMDLRDDAGLMLKN